MSQRHEFVLLAGHPGTNFRELCRRFGISAKTGYKWLARFKAGGALALEDRSRRPKRSPRLSSTSMCDLVVALRREEPTWGGRKLRRRLRDLGHAGVPAASTCTEILRRADLLSGGDELPPKPWQRFEHAYPNQLWQMDYKGDFATQSGRRCFPLTVLDDHSRFNLVLKACANQTGSTVKAALIGSFELYGLPEAILCDNAPPWGCAEPVAPYTSLTVWLLQLGVRVKHGRPYHPQTQGKDERFHRTLENDLIVRHTWTDLAHCDREFASYRQRYNCTRPHYSLDDDTPVSRYRPSPRPLPSQLLGTEYPSTDAIRRVRKEGIIVFANRHWYVGRGFGGLSIGLRPSAQADGQWEVFFGPHHLGRIDLTQPSTCYAESVYRQVSPTKSA